MTLPDRHMLLGMTVASICAAALLVGPGLLPALADDVAANAFDPSRLVKYEEREYLVDYDAWVATDPLTTTRVKKVEAGRVSYVTITTTATGTYSTDAMFSRHIQYPGISVQPAEPDRNFFSYWTNGRWSGFSTGNAGSFLYYRATRN